ncbi:hypothetical protein PIB30_009378 [Stylosanthes scabra]|uniref:Uncharacterized protein n=1 Tax=Stylosanthes scabra TaxID=79078 RepID=A0ABU6V7M8_9FABA|nr:hypothetical protein [Stylosanthes scabra]
MDRYWIRPRLKIPCQYKEQPDEELIKIQVQTLTTNKKMVEKLFYFIIHPNGVIVRRETGASFESNAPVMFRHNRVRTLVKLKQLILSHLGPAGGLQIGHLAYRF